jgi:CHASE2 domain-containing sensor protein
VLWHNDIFPMAVSNTCRGDHHKGRALVAELLNRNFRHRALMRSATLLTLAFIILTALSTFAWTWMSDPTFSVVLSK